MTARMRRLASDYEQVKKDFQGHKNIVVTPIGTEPPEKYHVTYFVNGIYLLPDGRIETLSRHEVEITLHAEYPRYKPICKIMTPIWHPNFRDGQICIGDIWGAGESLSDIIINIGDMIQYKSWNSFSPLSAEAAQWAMDNKHLFPVGNIELYKADYESAKDTVEIDLFDDNDEPVEDTAPLPEENAETAEQKPAKAVEELTAKDLDTNDFDITAEELAGIEFVPTAQRMQTVSHANIAKGSKINFKTVLVKGLLWAFIGAFIGFAISELCSGITSNKVVANMMGYPYLAQYYEYSDNATAEFDKIYSEFEKYCKANGVDPEGEDAFVNWYVNESNETVQGYFENYSVYTEDAEYALYDSFEYEFDSDEDKLSKGIASVARVSTALWSAIIALFIGLFLGVGEGVFYGSKEKGLKYALIGAGVSIVIGFISGYLAQWMYASMISEYSSDITAAFVRGLGWAIMGLGVGIAAGLIKPQIKRILYCALGGLGGGFIGGFLFNFVTDLVPNDIVARAIAIVIMGLLIGVGVGLLEQFAKQAWLKVIRGEFEGKEYLVFTGVTSIGNNGKNTIVLFKDKLVGPHHCDIILEHNKYVLVDSGTPMGTIVNGRRITRHILRSGDAIAIGNSVLVFNSK